MSSPDHLPTQQRQDITLWLCRSDGKPVKDISPWEVDKTLSLPHAPLDATLTTDGMTLQIHCTTHEHADHVRNTTNIAGHAVKVTKPRHRVQGTIWAPELDTMDTDYLAQGLADQQVTSVYRPPRGPRALLILTYMTDRLPPRAFAGYLSYEVRPLTPKPRRCQNCQRYGHLAAKCRSETACGQCAQGHKTSDCQSSRHKCAACGGPHPITDKDCPKWQLEKRVVTLISEGMAARQARSTAEREFGAQSPTPRRRLANPPRTSDKRHFPDLSSAYSTPQNTPPTLTKTGDNTRKTRPPTPSTRANSTASSRAGSRDSSPESSNNSYTDTDTERFAQQGARPKAKPKVTSKDHAPSEESGLHPAGGATYEWHTVNYRRKSRSHSQTPRNRSRSQARTTSPPTERITRSRSVRNSGEQTD